MAERGTLGRAPTSEPMSIRGTTSALQPQDSATTSRSVPHAALPMPRRRSSVAERLETWSNIGGPNSFNNFARSWQRAAGFHQITPGRRSFFLPSSDESWTDEHEHDRSEIEYGHGVSPARSMLKAALEHEGHRSSASHGDDAGGEMSEQQPLLRKSSTPDASLDDRLQQYRESPRRGSHFHLDAQIGSPMGGSYGASYGTVASSVRRSSMKHAAEFFRQHQESESQISTQDDQEPLLVKSVERDDGQEVDVVVGHSTVPQTVFNSSNTLIGVGMLALPLAINYCGWVIGMLFFLFATITTSYTAKLLAKCLDVDGSLITYADIAYVSFGSRARIATSILFSLELFASCVALVILFADSMYALIPGWSRLHYKILCGLLMIPLGMLPLRFLSVTSILGIICCFTIVVAIITDGLIKSHGPGSLRQPAHTHLWPSDIRTLPIAFGLLMAPWGGHSVFPNIYRDMRHSHKYGRAVNITYVFTYLLEATLAAVGYLMFGDRVLDEVTSNIFFRADESPLWLLYIIAIAIAVIPLTKLPLTARPITSTMEILFGIYPSKARAPAESGQREAFLVGARFATRLSVIVIVIMLSIFVPSFDKVMSLLGSFACFTVCIVLPCAFHLKLFDLSRTQRIIDWTLLVVCSILAIAGTIAAFLPEEMVGVKSKML